MRALNARQVVQAVGVLQLLHLGSEDEVEGRAQQGAKQVLLLGQAAHPQVYPVEPGEGAGAPLAVHGASVGVGERSKHIRIVNTRAVHEVVGILIKGCVTQGAVGHQIYRSSALVHQGDGIGNGLVRAVGRHKVDERARMLEELSEIVPAGIRL